jgi:type IV pilus assembly protein PilN|tara:strand:- start:2430 stop:4211 length:1782 start_codon:yes stop_codon:yes gene_type:complete
LFEIEVRICLPKTIELMKNLFKDLFKKKSENEDESNIDQADQTTKTSHKKLNKFLEKIKSKFNALVKKSAGKGEDVIGIELTTNEIRISQVSVSKDNQWILDKFYLHKIQLPENTSVLDNQNLVTQELQLAIQKSKIKVKNAAFAIPVTSAIIRVVTSPLMTNEELVKAIDTDSLWENLVQLTENLEEYSIFYQVIERHPKENTMDILFVASKLSDINMYTEIIKGADLNPVIVDVKCFAIKSAVDQINKKSGIIDESKLTAILEFGIDENYVMILHDNNPIITDIFIRAQDKKTLIESNNQEEMDSFTKRYMSQVKQAVTDFEARYEKRIRNLKVVSNLENIETYLGSFKKNLENTGFNLLDPFDGVQVPQQIKENLNLKNKSHLSTIIGLAFRKLDVFGYYKFVTAAKNINLLPDRNNIIADKKMKFFSNFAFKGSVGAMAIIYFILFGLSAWQIMSYNSKLVGYGQTKSEHETLNKELAIVTKELQFMTKSLKLSKSIKSNKVVSFRYLAQIANSVPNRVQFNKIEYDGKNQIIIEGTATNDRDILKLINNLSTKSLIAQASLAKMSMPQSSGNSNVQRKGFKIAVKTKG